MKDLKTIRGMPDLYAEEMNRISFVEGVCTKIFRTFKFQDFRTPILENKSLFELLEETNMLATSIESNNSVRLITTNKNFSSNGKTLRKQGVIRKIYCIF